LLEPADLAGREDRRPALLLVEPLRRADLRADRVVRRPVDRLVTRDVRALERWLLGRALVTLRGAGRRAERFEDRAGGPARALAANRAIAASQATTVRPPVNRRQEPMVTSWPSLPRLLIPPSACR
jgi:hypothetical protein